MVERVTELVKMILRKSGPIGIGVDMTLGNGHDALFLLDDIRVGYLYGFDIQDEAIEKSKKLLGPRDNLSIIKDSHENLDKYIKEEINLAVYNLGYLPGSNKIITTRAESTIKSLEILLEKLAKNGRVIITVYYGHDEGKIEERSLDSYIKALDPKEYAIMKISYPNKENSPPYILIIDKKV